MINIAVCMEDNDRIYNILVKYMVNQEYLYKIIKFTSEEQLLQTQFYIQLIIMDTIIDGADGIELAVKMKEKNKRLVVIFITNHSSYIFRAVNEVHPFAYLRKMVSEEQFIKQLKELKTYVTYRRTNNQLIRLKLIDISKEGIIGYKYKNFAIDDILYFEYVNRKVKICLEHKEYYFYDTLKHVFDQVKQYSFQICHKSYIVNLEHIKQIKGCEIILDNGKKIRISQKRACEFRKQLKVINLIEKQS
jgi:DNA-binding LytR/AlgR family response regulator